MMNIPEKEIPVHHLTSEQFQMSTLSAAGPENFHDVHRHNFFEIIWFREVYENSRLELDFESYKVENNQICIIAPGQVFNMKIKGEEGYAMAISREIFNEACNIESVLTGGSLPFSLDPENEQTCHTIMLLIQQEYKGAARTELLKSYLKAFCIIIGEQINPQEPLLNDRQRIQELITLIEKHYIRHRETGFYAEKLKISTHHLNDIVRLLRGTTVKKMISQRLILEAKRELSFGALTVKEIAFKLGFRDASYFSRFFKKHTGQNPDGFKFGNT
ncbi:helix-turn-helix domain-containing protein [Chryseobacterium indologenes]|uniref:Helix-turn-helix domain-containing protein n=1 Tax=Chryseobacterium indologenes TaxID=253 RepID=A0AAD0YYA0_CHRID|nr:helix-turn-helix domain-containing protein [Chryseobacterium indologenes]AYZ37747.1 helix-turn-helix domain-containing protein [Chryseobacterium indologenes]AZB19051.1 helix-turn-helix domain-containing protein [Chryseobacterium indologenes]MBF6646642.1 helix-turn-helix domain-containing protein [Chryseobacterium indologenes]MBU3047855.1 helix-turn-helix domain-containing protein [Chryseobacterium indologenes]MEB4760491.1 helix-turn-helix domain-containing protein [Chryseobacterium indologe